MVKEAFLVGIALLLASLLMLVCSVPQGDYDAIMAAKEATDAELALLGGEVSLLRDQVFSLTSELASVDKEVASNLKNC